MVTSMFFSGHFVCCPYVSPSVFLRVCVSKSVLLPLTAQWCIVSHIKYCCPCPCVCVCVLVCAWIHFFCLWFFSLLIVFFSLFLAIFFCCPSFSYSLSHCHRLRFLPFDLVSPRFYCMRIHTCTLVRAHCDHQLWKCFTIVLHALPQHRSEPNQLRTLKLLLLALVPQIHRNIGTPHVFYKCNVFFFSPTRSGLVRLQNNKQRFINKSILTNETIKLLKELRIENWIHSWFISFRIFNCSGRGIATTWNCQKVFFLLFKFYKLISKAAKYNGSLLIALC